MTGGTKAGFSFVDTPVQYHSDASVRTFTYLYFHAKYAQLMLYPWTLSWDYSHDALPLLRATWRDVRVLAIVAAYLGVSAIACWGLSKRSRKTLLGLSNVIIPFVPASNLFFVVGVTVGERLLYPCNVGAVMVLASIGSDSSRTRQRARPSLKAVLGAGLLVLFAHRCRVRVYQWSNQERLFAADAVSYPFSTKAQHQIGTILHRLSRFDEALAHFNASLKIFSQSALTEYCVAQIYIETGRPAEALAMFERILSGHGMGFGRFNLYALYVDYGFTLMLLKRYEDAVNALLEGLQMNEDVPHGLNALGYTFMQMKKAPEAIQAFQKGLQYDPENTYLQNNLGVALMMAGNLEHGAALIAHAAEREQSIPSFQHNVAVLATMMKTGEWPTKPKEQLILELFYNRGS